MAGFEGFQDAGAPSGGWGPKREGSERSVLQLAQVCQAGWYAVFLLIVTASYFCVMLCQLLLCDVARCAWFGVVS